MFSKFNTKARRFDPFVVLKTFMIAFLIIVFVAIICMYIANSLFGKRSVGVLLQLQEQKAFLYRDTQRLKKENAELQKELLEKQSLDVELK